MRQWDYLSRRREITLVSPSSLSIPLSSCPSLPPSIHSVWLSPQVAVVVAVVSTLPPSPSLTVVGRG